MRGFFLWIVHAVAARRIHQEKMRSPSAARNGSTLAVEFAQRLSETVGIPGQLHRRSIRQIDSFAPQKRHAGSKHAEREKPQRELDGDICEKDGEEQKVANGTKYGFFLGSCIKEVVDVISLKPGSTREQIGYGGCLRRIAGTFFEAKSVTHDAP